MKEMDSNYVAVQYRVRKKYMQDLLMKINNYSWCKKQIELPV